MHYTITLKAQESYKENVKIESSQETDVSARSPEKFFSTPSNSSSVSRVSKLEEPRKATCGRQELFWDRDLPFVFI